MLAIRNNALQKQFKITVFAVMMVCSFHAWSLPWLQLHPQKENNIRSSTQSNISSQAGEINFSGDWKGECNNQPVINLTIKHQSNSIILSYGFMEEKYQIGAMKTESSSQSPVSESNSNSVVWSRDGKSLIFTNTTQFMNGDGQLNAFFSQVSLSLEGDCLIILGEYYQGSNQLGEVKKDSLTCTYRRY